MDTWSVGCIFAEMLGRRVLFEGTNTLQQLARITDVLGTPAEAELAAIESARARTYMREMPFKPRVPFSQLYPDASPLALELLEQLLAFDPARRITVEAALAHPYLAAIHEPTYEPCAAQPFSFEFEQTPTHKSALRQQLTAEIVAFHPHAALEEAEVLAALNAAAADSPSSPAVVAARIAAAAGRAAASTGSMSSSDQQWAQNLADADAPVTMDE